MNNILSFGLTTPFDLMKKLRYDHEQYEKDHTSEYNALNCAMTAWHMTEWVFWHEHPEGTKNEWRLFRDKIISECPSLKIMQDIANGTKHCKLDHPNSTTTRKKGGAYSRAYSRAFSTVQLKVKSGDSEELYFQDEIKKVVEFWADYLG